ncbi:MAG: hypothetical protein LBL92_06225 [Propionibacteriaceae bacterium]|jgi:hypothetical protein|nr:hypothetical protein [Propionibacteriaceae bacterium]
MIDDRIRQAFDSVQADEELITRTMTNVTERLTEPPQTPSHWPPPRLWWWLLGALVVVVGVLLMRAVLSTPTDTLTSPNSAPQPAASSAATPSTTHPFDSRVAYRLYLEVNPALELQLNADQWVVSATGLNSDGEAVIADLTLTQRDLETALNELLAQLASAGYLNSEALLVTDIASTEDASALMTTVQSQLTEQLAAAGSSPQVETQVVDEQTADLADSYSITPTKYLAIRDLLSVDPQATVEQYCDRSITEIRHLAYQHRHGQQGLPSPNSGSGSGTGAGAGSGTGQHQTGQGSTAHPGRHGSGGRPS